MSHDFNQSLAIDCKTLAASLQLESYAWSSSSTSNEKYSLAGSAVLLKRTWLVWQIMRWTGWNERLWRERWRSHHRSGIPSECSAIPARSWPPEWGCQTSYEWTHSTATIQRQRKDWRLVQERGKQMNA